MNDDPLPTTPPNEPERLATLRQLMLLDTAPEPVFDRITRMAAAICRTPIALVSLVDEDRQWFKAAVGLPDVQETKRSISFCTHTVQSDDVFEVPDAHAHPLFHNNPLVTGTPNIRFYAGAPLCLRNGARVGSLCVIAPTPGELNSTQREQLRALADIASAAMEMRRDLISRSIESHNTYEQVLEHREAHYRAIVEDQTELISLATPDGLLTYVNPAYAAHFGRTPDAMVGLSLYDFIDPADRAAVRERFGQVLAHNAPLRSENRMTSANGSTRWVSWTNGISRDANGHAVVHSVGRDITEQKAAEEALRTSQAFLFRTGRIAGVGGWELNLQTQHLVWSEETHRIHEAPAHFQPTVDAALALYPPEAAATLREHIDRALRTGESWDLELPMHTFTGRPIWVRAVGEVEYVPGTDRTPLRLIGAFQDITQRKQLEQEKATQTTMLHLITEAIPAAVAAIDMDDRYTFTNTAYANLFSKTPAELRGLGPADLLAEPQYAARLPYIRRAQGGEHVTAELSLNSSGSMRYASMSYIPLLDGQRVHSIVVVGQDITPQRLEALRLLELTQRDPLTGLLNRSGFQQFLERQVIEGHGALLGVLYIDLDDFKPINDRFGHPVGDEVLKQFGARLQSIVREDNDAVARLGGDEFAIALSRLPGIDAARQVADKILGASLVPFSVGSHQLHTHASVGLAYGVRPTSDAADLVHRADTQLLQAKAAGKGRRAG